MNRRTLNKYRVTLTYRADGMTRPLVYRQILDAEVAAEAVQLAVNEISSAYVSGFEVESWTLDYLDKPVLLRYVETPEEEVQAVGHG